MGQKRDRQPEEMPADKLSPREEACLKAAKEIVVKFIETGRVSVASFNEAFDQIYRSIKATISRTD